MAKKQKSDKTHRGNASQFFVAGELCRRGLVAVVTLGNCPNTDILCSDKAGKKFVHIQVKTFVPGNKTCTVGLKAETVYGENFFWILGGIPTPKSERPFTYYIIPAADMAREVAAGHKSWLSKLGRKGQPRNATNMRTVRLPPSSSHWDLTPFTNRWDLIEDRLQ